jgi:transposase
VHQAGNTGPAELAELFNVGRFTVYRVIKRARTRTS